MHATMLQGSCKKCSILMWATSVAVCIGVRVCVAVWVCNARSYCHCSCCSYCCILLLLLFFRRCQCCSSSCQQAAKHHEYIKSKNIVLSMSVWLAVILYRPALMAANFCNNILVALTFK